MGGREGEGQKRGSRGRPVKNGRMNDMDSNTEECVGDCLFSSVLARANRRGEKKKRIKEEREKSSRVSDGSKSKELEEYIWLFMIISFQSEYSFLSLSLSNNSFRLFVFILRYSRRGNPFSEFVLLPSPFHYSSYVIRMSIYLLD